MWLLVNPVSPQDDDLSDESELMGGDGVSVGEEALGTSVTVCRCEECAVCVCVHTQECVYLIRDK